MSMRYRLPKGTGIYRYHQETHIWSWIVSSKDAEWPDRWMCLKHNLPEPIQTSVKEVFSDPNLRLLFFQLPTSARPFTLIAVEEEYVKSYSVFRVDPQ